MKNIFATILLAISSIAISAQSIPTYCISMGLTGARNLCGTATFDGGYVAGGIVGIGSSQNNFLGKCDGEGNLSWSHQVGSDFTDDFFGIIETSDHFIVAVGFENGIMCMYKFDKDGTEIWKKNIAVQSSGVLYDIIETSDGNYLLTGYSQNASFQYFLAVIKVTADGDLIWNKNLYGFYHGELGYSCTETADHRYVIGAYSSAFSNQFFLVSLDESGNMQWVKKSVDGGVAYDLVATSDSCVIVAGYICKATGCDAMISKVDSSGNLVWSYTYGDSLFERFYSIAALPGGGFVMAGDATDQSTEAHGFIVKCDKNGQMQWGKTAYGNEFRSVATSADGGIVGSLTGGTGYKMMKLDSDGNACPECATSNYGVQNSGTTLTDWTLSEYTSAAVISSSTINESNGSSVVTVYCSEVGIADAKKKAGLEIFPDPADDHLTIQCSSLAASPSQIFITDLSGRMLMQVSPAKKLSEEISIDLESLPAASYLLVVKSPGELITKKFVVAR